MAESLAPLADRISKLPLIGAPLGLGIRLVGIGRVHQRLMKLEDEIASLHKRLNASFGNVPPPVHLATAVRTTASGPSDAVPVFHLPASQACSQSQFETPEFRYWCDQIKEPVSYQRKLWEYCYLLQALSVNGMLAPGRRGLCFAAGREPTIAAIAARGASVLATDADAEIARADWIETGQHASAKSQLNERSICPPELFDRLVDFRIADMNAIPEDLTDFDFAWSLCACEHLGSIEQGLAFLENSMRCVKPGGVLVHTTELNISSDEETIETGSSILFRKHDLLRLQDQLRRAGHHVSLNFTLGSQEHDLFVDEAPYRSEVHLRLRLGGFVATSFGLIVTKARHS